MKKKLAILIVAAIAALSFALAGCSSEPEAPADLTGEWVQVDAGESYQAATITDDSITINWISDGGKTTSLYWAGTYTAPTEPGDYSWTSENDTSQTDYALMASTSATKDFAYSDGKISYQVSALGTTTTIELERTE